MFQNNLGSLWKFHFISKDFGNSKAIKFQFCRSLAIVSFSTVNHSRFHLLVGFNCDNFDIFGSPRIGMNSRSYRNRAMWPWGFLGFAANQCHLRSTHKKNQKKMVEGIGYPWFLHHKSWSSGIFWGPPWDPFGLSFPHNSHKGHWKYPWIVGQS